MISHQALFVSNVSYVLLLIKICTFKQCYREVEGGHFRRHLVQHSLKCADVFWSLSPRTR